MPEVSRFYGINMIPRIKSYQPLADFQLLVSFDDGRKVRYDVADDIKTLPAFHDLQTEHGLFENVNWMQVVLVSIGMIKLIYQAMPFMNME